jgi:hypothetical protein
LGSPVRITEGEAPDPLAGYRRGLAKVASGSLEDLDKTHGNPSWSNPENWR